MSFRDRQKQFEQAIGALPDIQPLARIATNFGYSNSSRVLGGGLFACTNNLQNYTKHLMKGESGLVSGAKIPFDQLILLCVITFPPDDEVYFAISTTDANRINDQLKRMGEGINARNKTAADEGGKAGSINNNVKFYVTNGGNLYFDNEFAEHLEDKGRESELDANRLVRIDAIHFSIWPPAASARRSLLARQFVGYLGNLVGRQKVHELRVWDEAGTVSPEMQRLPSSLPVANIEAAVTELGGHYPGGEVRRFHGALNFLRHKHFVILAGLSGTGKTQLAIKYARAVHGLPPDAEDPFLIICPVRPEWIDPTGLTGYFDVLSNRYIAPPFLQAVLLATAHRDSPVFVVLDEMNLARVEYYFSDVLSAIETGQSLQLHTEGVPLEGSTGTAIPSELPLPDNLFIVGTINIDETTNAVSDKVLDRAMLIDMSAVDLPGFLQGLEGREPALAAARAACEPYLLAAYELMAPHGLGFGYRVAEEVVRYAAFASTSLGQDADSSLDQLMVQKVLIKLKGTDRQRGMLTSLQGRLPLPKTQFFLRKLLNDLDEFSSFQASR